MKTERLAKLLNISEVTEILNISKHTLYAWTSGKRIKHRKIGGRILFHESDINEFINSRTIEAL